MKTLRQHRKLLGWFMTCLMAVWLPGQNLHGAFYWDSDAAPAGNAVIGTGLGGTGTWDTSLLNWWDGIATDGAWTNGTNNAIFTGTAGTVTLGAPITAGGLTFSNANAGNYLITGDTLTLSPATGTASPIIAVNNVGFGTNRATISSLLAGTSGFTKTGNGTLRLTGANTGLSGDIAIKGGNVVITNPNQLGTGTTAISVTGIASTGIPGFSGGTLSLQGTTTSASSAGITLTREVSVSGRGPGAVNNSGGLMSIGYNTLAGGLTLAAGASESRVFASHGTTTISGPLYLGTGNLPILQGSGNWNISGQVTGVDTAGDRFMRGTGVVSSVMWLQNNNNNFAQPLRLDSFARVATNGALGISTVAGAVDFNGGGTLEVRTDAPAGFSTRNLSVRGGQTGNIFVDHALTGSLGLGGLSNFQNQTVTFGNAVFTATNSTTNLTSRNGWGASFQGASGTIGSGGNNSPNINNNSSGTLTLAANLWGQTDGTARTLSIGGNAETTVTGNVLATGAAHVLAKNGTGVLTYGGTAGTYTGSTNINAGTLSIANVGAVAGTSQINIGNATTTSGTLNYTGGLATLAKNININTTTASAFINASGSGALTLSGTFSTVAASTKTLVLGGTNTADNTITSVLPNPATSGALNLQKIGIGTWVLAPTTSNLFTGSTTISNGILKLTDGAALDVLPDAGAVIFNVDNFTQSAGGTLTYTGGANSETVGALTSTAGHGIVNAVSGTLTFASLGARTAGGTVNVSNTGTVNVTGTAGFLNAGAYFNSADFAYSGAGTTLRAPVYGTDAGFVDAAAGAATLTAASHNQVTGAITAQTTAAINSLKINGANDLTLDAAQTLTVGTAAGSGILLTGGSSTISGGTAIAVSAAANDFAIRVDGSGNTLTINTPLTTSTAGLTKSGNGTLVLGASNTITAAGAVTINEGTLRLATGGTLGVTDIDLVIRQGGTFDLGGVNVGTLTSGGVDILRGAGTITNSNATGALLRVGNGGTSGYFTGAINDGTGTVNLVKGGGGTLSLTNNTSTFSTLTLGAGTVAFALPAGTTTMNAGVASPIGMGSTAAGLVFNGGTLLYTGANATIFSQTQTPSISTDRLFTLAGNGTIQSSGQYGNTVLAAGTQNNASLVFSNTSAISFSGTGVRTLTLGGNSIGDNVFRPQIVNNTNASEATSLTKADGGLWILDPSSANTYSGATTVSGGALRAVDGTGLSSNSNLTLNGGVFEVAGSTTFTRTLGTAAGNVQLTGGNSGFANAGTDRLVVTIGGGAITWGGTTFNPGQLVLSSTTALGETEVTNAIALGTAARTVTVNSNGNTGNMVTAGILSGVISGGVGGQLNKTGGGVLMLGDANIYVGNTQLQAGSLVLTSIGASGDTETSIGTNVSGGILQLGNGTTGTGNILYVGQGETTTRTIQMNTNTSSPTIDSSGSGALVLTALTNNVGGTKNLNLRGFNTDSNRITSVLSDNGGPLTIIKQDGGVWILDPTGPQSLAAAIQANGGLLGLTANAIGAGGVSLANGGIFAYGGPLSVTRNITLANNATAVFAGQNSMTFTGTVTKAGGANDQTLSLNMENGATLTFIGNYVNNENPAAISTRTLNIRGMSSLVWDGVIADSANVASTSGVGGSRTALNIAIANDASITMSGAANTYTGNTTLSQGTLILNKVTALGAPAFGGTPTLIFNGGVVQAGTPLTGPSALANPVTLGGDPATFSGSNSIELTGLTTNSAGNRLLQNNLTGGASLTVTGNVNLSNDGTGRTLIVLGSGPTTVNGIVQNGGAGAGGLTYSGNNTLTLNAANTATGALTANRGTISLAGAAGAWTAGTFTLNANGILQLDNSVTNNNNRLFDTGAVTMNAGTLSLVGNATTELAGALTVNGIMGTINMSGTGSNTLTFASVNFANSGSSLDLTGITSLGVNNKLLFTAAPAELPATTGILSRVMIANDFATYDVTNGVQAFTGYNTSDNLDTALATDTMEVDATAGLLASRTLNALKINGSGLTVGTAGRTLTLTAGSILNTGGNNTINAAQIGFTNQGLVQVEFGTTLDVNGAFTGIINKAGAGTLNLNTEQFYNSTTNISGGTVVLNGGLNTLFASGAAVPGTTQIDVGATLDLNGNTQYVGGFASVGSALPNTGGTLTTTSGTPLFVMRDAANFGGQITGTINLARLGAGTQVFSSANSVTGALTLMGGTTSLRDDGTFLNTTGVDINYATLTFDNNASLQTQNNNRLNDAAGITLRGGSIIFTGRISTAASETLGALTIDQGANIVTATATAGTIYSADLTFASLTRNNNSTLNFTGTNLGQQGVNSRIVFQSPLTTVLGGALGPWAIANSTDYAAYNSGNGIGIVGQGGYTGYDAAFGTGLITQIPATAATTSTLGLVNTTADTTTAAMLRIAGAFQNDIAFAEANDILNLELGGLLRSDNNNGTLIGTTALRGVLTAGGTEASGTRELITYNNQNTITINSVIANNGLGNAVRLIKDGAGTLTLTAANTFTGGTVLNRGTLNLTPTITDGSVVVLPTGGITINGGVTGTGTTLNVNTSGAIAAGNDVTLNGRAALTYATAATTNSLASITLNNIGGEAAPTVTIGTGGTLTVTGSAPITATSSNAANTATITGGTVALASGANAFNVAPIAVGAQTYTINQPTLSIASIISGVGASITKSGNGILQLGGANTFTGGVTTTGTSGGILIAANSTPTGPGAGTGLSANGVTSGPLGTGTLTLASGNALLVDNTSRTVFNPVVFSGTPTFRNTSTTAVTTTLNGAITTPSGALTINVDNPFLTAALQGAITNIASVTSVTKTGLGNLIINLTGSTALPVTLNEGGTLGILHDGDGDVQNEAINIGAITMSASPPNLTIGRSGQTVLWNQAVNKILSPTSFSSVNNGIALTANNGYGLVVQDAVALSTLVGAGPTFNVAGGARNSNVVNSMEVTGQITGGATGASNVVFTKTGNGTLKLGNATNSFGSTSAIIDVTAGILSGASNGAFGNSSNVVRLSANSGTQGLRLEGGTTYTLTGRTINLNAATVGIDVTPGTVATLDTPFTFSAATNALQKNDLGTLRIDANNSSRTGVTNIAGGVLVVDNANDLGSGQIVLNGAGVGGSALFLEGGVALTNPINMAAAGTPSGINNTGGVFSASGVNSIGTVGAVTNTASIGITFGAANGATLNIGSLALGNSPTFNAVGTGIININGSIGTAGVTMAKVGTGTLNWTTAQTTAIGIAVNQGTFGVNGSGIFSSGTGAITVQNNGLLAIDDTGTAATRFGGARTVGLTNGNLTYTANGTAVSTQAFGALTSSWGANTITLNNAGPSDATLTFASVGAVAGGSVLTFASSGTFNTTTHRVVFTAAPTLTNGIMQRAVIRDASGTNFVTGAAATPISAFSTYTVSDGTATGTDLTFTNVNGGTAYGINASNVAGIFSTVPTYRVTGDTTALSNPGLNFRGINALKIEGNNTDVTFATSGGTQLAIGTGNILATGTGQTLGSAALVATNSAPALFFGTISNTNSPAVATAPVFTSAEGGIMVDTGADLTVNAALYNTANVTKGLGGNLIFNTKQYFNTGVNYFTINGGTVTLNGGENTLWQGAQGAAALTASLAVGPGATLQLNGNSQMVGELRSPNGTAFAGSGGTIVNGVADTATLISVNSAAAWGGNISSGTGAIFYNKSGASTQTIYSDNTYTGGTLINGGALTLTDEGRLSGTTAITINNAALNLTDAGTMANADRINNAATISMRGGNLSLTGRDLWNSYEQVGAITLAGAQNNLTATVAANGSVRSAVLETGNLTQNNFSTLLWGGASGQMGNAGRIIIANGTSLLVNGIIPWATGGAEFGSYVNPTAGNATGGLASLNAAGYQGYDASIIPAGAGTTTQNLRLASASFVVPDVNIGSAGTYNANAIHFVTSANNQVLSFADNADTLNLNSGGLSVSGNFTGKTIGSAVGNGFLTSGGTQNSGTAPLYLTQNQGTVLVNSSIVDNGNGAATRFVYTPFNGAVITFNAANTYTGGTQLNGNVSHTGTLALNVTGGNGGSTVAIPAGDLEINNATVRLDQASQIHNSVVPVLHGAGTLNLNNFNQTLAGLSFINDGSGTAASVTTGTGILTLTGGITASSSNVGSVSTISGAGTGGIAVDLGGTTRTLTVNPVIVNGNSTVANATPTLAISSPISSSTNLATTGLTKAGNGLLQLSGASLFGGGVTVNAGGLLIAGSSTGTRDALGVVTGFTNGPLGTGALTINANGTFLQADATARTLNNDYVFGAGVNNLTFRGTGTLTLNGATSLTNNTTFTVEAPQGILTLNGLIGESTVGLGITKEGLGTLLLGSNNTFTGGLTLNAGTLALAGINSGSTAPVFGGTNVTINDGGLLALQNNGTGSNGLISYANNIVINGALASANLHVANNGANTGNAIEIADLTLNGGQILNISSANNYGLRLLNVSGDTVGGAVPRINVAAGLTVTILGYTGDAPINVGQGTLLFPDIVTIGTPTTLSGGAVVLNGSYPLSVSNATLSGANMTSFGYTAGSLTGNFATLAAAPTAVFSTANAGIGFTGSNFSVNTLADGAFGNRPNTMAGTGVNSVATFSGFLEVTGAGNYTFRSGTDDGMTLYINGNAVASDAFGHAFTDSAAVTVPLTAGYHSIVYKFANGGGGGGYRVLYSGPDTGNAFQTVGGSKTFATTALPTAANGFNGAAIINNDYSLAASTTATIDTAGTIFGAVIDPSKSLTLGANSVLNVVNGTFGSFGSGWFGAGGATTIGNGAILATTNTATAGAGTLQLLGAITQSGTGLVSGGNSNALIKAGQGTLVLGANNTATFTGDIAIQGGTVMLNNAAGLPAGVTTVSNTTLAAQAAATTVSGSAVITGITSTASMQQGMAVTGTGIPTGAYIVSVDSASQITISQNATASATIANLVGATSGTLDLNGQTAVAGNVTINGAGSSALASGSTGALWNSSGNAASLSGPLTLATSATVGGFGNLTLGVINSAATTVTMTKAGANTLFLNTANNTTLLGPIALANGIIQIGDANALGAATSLLQDGTTISSGAVLDLNGQTTSEFLSINGVGRANFTAARNTLGSLVNTAAGTATVNSALVLAANASVGSDWINAISGGAAGGDITLGGIVSGAFALTKVGSNTLNLTAANTFNALNITQGTVALSGAGTIGSGGAVTVGTGVVTGITPANTLSLDYATNATANRLTDAQALTLNGGTLVISGHASTAVTESLTTGALAFGNQHNLVTLINNGANVQLLSTGAGTLTRAVSATAFIRGTNIGSAAPAAGNTNIIFGTAPGTTGSTDVFGATTATGIIPWIVIESGATAIGGTTATFANYTAAAGLQPMAAGNFAAALPTAGTANSATDLNIRTTAPVTLANTTTSYQTTGINSLTFNAAATGVTINDKANLSLDSGGILATASNTIGGAGMINVAGNREALVHVYGANTLTIDVPLGGAVAPTTGGLTKAGNGTLILGAANGNNYTGTTTLNLGTVQLGASAPDNALFYHFSTGPAINATASAQASNALVSNSGSTFDLNGHNQTFGDLLSRGSLVGTGGIITNTAGGGAVTFTTTVGTARDFAGSINGNLNFVKTGAAQLTLRDNNAFTGNATFMGSVTALFDQGRFSGMGAGDTISVRNSLLRWDDSGIQAMNNRIASTVAINLDGGAFEYISRGATTDSITLGNLSLTGGSSTLRVNAGNASGFGVGTINLGGTFSRSTGATLNFTSAANIVGGGSFFTATAVGLNTNTNGIIGGWATVNTFDGTTAAANLEFAVYDPIVGVRQMNNVEQTATFALSSATSNLRRNASDTVLAGGQTINSLTLNGGASTVSFLSNTDTLTLASGGLLSGSDNAARTLGSTATRGRITSGGSELFIHNGANTLTIHSDITGTLNPVFTSGGLNGGAVINLNNANTYVGTAYVNGVILSLGTLGNTPTTNAITGDLIITGGNVNGTGSGAIANSRVALNANNQINDASNVTVRGGSQLDTNGFNDTIATLTFNSQGGYADGGPLVQTGSGRLTLTGNITSTNLDDIRSVPTISGNLGLAASPTITVDKVTGTTVLGTRGDMNEQIGLVLNADVTGGATLNKAGLGALLLGGVSESVTLINVDAGSVVLGAATNYTNARIDLDAGTILDMRGASMAAAGRIGNVTGSGLVKNFSPTAGGTLVTGSANVNATFDGTLASDYTSGLLNVTKIGTGNWTLTADNSANILGNLQINAGAVVLDGTAAKVGFVTTILAEGGTLTLDNSTNALNNRLGGTTSVQATAADRTFSNRGGVLNFIGGGTTVTEALNTVTNLEGASQWTLSPGTAGTTITLRTLSATSGTNRGTLLLSTTGLLGGGVAGSGRVNVFATTPTLTANIRADMVGTDSSGTGFVTHDANGFRLLTSADTALGYDTLTGIYLGTATPAIVTATGGTVDNTTATANLEVTSGTGLYASTTINSLNLTGTGGVSSFGGGVTAAINAGGSLFNAAGAQNTLTITSGGILAETGNTGISGGAITAGATNLYFHTLANLTSSAYILGTGRMVKDGAGTLTLNQRSLNTQPLDILEGTVVLNGGANTLLVIPTATTASVADLVVNGGTLDLNGNSQAVARLTHTSTTTYANGAGTVTNTNGTFATLTANSTVGSNSFAGVLAGNLNFEKVGTNTQTLYSTNTYAGTTTVRGGILELRDSATAGSGAISLNYGALLLNNGGLNHVSNRTGSSAFTLNGGQIQITPRLEGETSVTLGNITLAQGLSQINFNAQAGVGGSVNVTAGTLTRTAGSGTYLNFTSGTGQIGRGTSANGGQSPQLTFSVAPALTNGAIGGWAIHNGDQYLTYISTPTVNGDQGVAVLGDTSIGAAATAYTVNSTVTAATTLASSGAANNIRYQTGTNNNFDFTMSGNYTANTLTLSIQTTGNRLVTAAFGDTLTLTTGGLLRTGNQAFTVGQGLDFGRITSSASELFLYNNQNTMTVNSRITGTNRLVLGSANGGTTVLTNGTSANLLGTTSTGVAQVTLASTTGLAVGQNVSGTIGGVAYSGTIVSVDSASLVTLSSAPASGTAFLNYGSTGALTGITATWAAAANPTFTLNAGTTAGMYVGQPVFGAGIPSGATVSAITGSTTFTLAGTTTAAGAAANITPGTAGNSYSGGTTIDGGTVTLTPAGTGQVVIPAGGLIINNAAVNFGGTSNFGLIASTNAVTINGGGSLTLPNYTAVTPAQPINNTLASVTFNNNGGTGTPTLALGAPAANQLSRLILTDANAITVVNDNYASTPTISGTFTSTTQAATLEFSNASPVINVSGSSPIGLSITAAISQNVGNTNPISKTGSGSLVLSSGSSRWTTGLALNGGTLILGASSGPATASTVAAPVAINFGPLGLGTLTMADGTTVQTDNTARTVSNAINFAVSGTASGFTIGGTGTGHNLTLNGVVDFGTATRTITVTSPQVTATIGGQITSGAGSGLTKAGNGILVLSQIANDYTGATKVNGGLLQLGAAGVIPNASELQVFGGGTFNINGFAETVGALTSDSATQGGLVTNSGAAATLTVGSGDGSGTFGGVITNGTNALNLAKTGTGNQTLTQSHTYTGTTAVNDGTLTLTGSLSTGAVTVAKVTGDITQAAVLAGQGNLSTTGVMGGAVTLGSVDGLSLGALMPGTAVDDIGLLKAASLTVNQGSQIEFNLSQATTILSLADLNAVQNALTAGTYTGILSLLGTPALNGYNNVPVVDNKHDYVQLTGALSVNSDHATPLFRLANSSTPYTAQMGDVFNLLDWTGLGMTFTGTNTSLTAADFDFPSLGADYTFDFSAFSSHGILVVIPEPSRILLLMVGLALVFLRRRRL